MEPPDGIAMGLTYEIQFQGTLAVELSGWLGGVTEISEVRNGDTSTTCLTLRVPDQAALRGVLNRLWDLNMTLTSVRMVAAIPDKETEHER
jgi:hypothetical protein